MAELESAFTDECDDDVHFVDKRQLEHQAAPNPLIDSLRSNMVLTPVGVMESTPDLVNSGLNFSQLALSTTPHGACYRLQFVTELEADKEMRLITLGFGDEGWEPGIVKKEYRLVPCRFEFTRRGKTSYGFYKKIPLPTVNEVKSILEASSQDEIARLCDKYKCPPSGLLSHIPSQGRGRRVIASEALFVTGTDLDEAPLPYLQKVTASLVALDADCATEEDMELLRELLSSLSETLDDAEAKVVLGEVPKLANARRLSLSVLGLRLARDEYEEDQDRIETFLPEPVHHTDFVPDDDTIVSGIPPGLFSHLKTPHAWKKFVQNGAMLIPEGLDEAALAQLNRERARVERELKQNQKSRAEIAGEYGCDSQNEDLQVFYKEFALSTSRLEAELVDLTRQYISAIQPLLKGNYGVVTIQFLNDYAERDGVGRFFKPFISGKPGAIPTFHQINDALQALSSAVQRRESERQEQSEWAARSTSMTALFDYGSVGSADSDDELSVETAEDVEEYYSEDVKDQADPWFVDEAEIAMDIRPRASLGSRVPDAVTLTPQQELMSQEIARKSIPRDILAPRATFGLFAQELPWSRLSDGTLVGHPLAKELQSYIDAISAPRTTSSIGLTGYDDDVFVVKVPFGEPIYKQTFLVNIVENQLQEDGSIKENIIGTREEVRQYLSVNEVWSCGTLERLLLENGVNDYYHGKRENISVRFSERGAVLDLDQDLIWTGDPIRSIWISEGLEPAVFWKDVNLQKLSMLSADRLWILQTLSFQNGIRTIRVVRKRSEEDNRIWLRVLVRPQESLSGLTYIPFPNEETGDTATVAGYVSPYGAIDPDVFEDIVDWYEQYGYTMPVHRAVSYPSYGKPRPPFAFEVAFSSQAEIQCWKILSSTIDMFVRGKLTPVPVCRAFPHMWEVLTKLLATYFTIPSVSSVGSLRFLTDDLKAFQKASLEGLLWNINAQSVKPFISKLNNLNAADSRFLGSKDFDERGNAYTSLVSLKSGSSDLSLILGALNGVLHAQGKMAPRAIAKALGYMPSHQQDPKDALLAMAKDSVFRRYQPWGSQKFGPYSSGTLGDAVNGFVAHLYMSARAREMFADSMFLWGQSTERDGEAVNFGNSRLCILACREQYGHVLGSILWKSFYKKVQSGRAGDWLLSDILNVQLPPVFPNFSFFHTAFIGMKAKEDGLIESSASMRAQIEETVTQAMARRSDGLAAIKEFVYKNTLGSAASTYLEVIKTRKGNVNRDALRNFLTEHVAAGEMTQDEMDLVLDF